MHSTLVCPQLNRFEWCQTSTLIYLTYLAKYIRLNPSALQPTGVPSHDSDKPGASRARRKRGAREKARPKAQTGGRDEQPGYVTPAPFLLSGGTAQQAALREIFSL